MMTQRDEAPEGLINQGGESHQQPGANPLKKALAEIEKKLGICGPCITSSICLTIVFWALLIFVAPFVKIWYVVVGLWFLACSFLLLSLAHLVRFLYLNLRKSGNAPRGREEQNSTKE